MNVNPTAWAKKLSTREGENPACLVLAFLLLLLLPWMLVFARAGAEICAGGIGLLFLWRSTAMHDWQWLRAPLTVAALLAWAWLMFVVSPFALNPEKSFLLALPWIRYILLFTAMRYWLLTTRTGFGALAVTLVVLLEFCAVDTLWQFYTGMSLTQHPIWYSGRLTGPLDTPKIGILMARFMLPAFAALSLLTCNKSWHIRLNILCALMACSAMILLTGERTAFFLSTASLLLVLMLMILREKKARIYGVLLMVILTATTVMLFTTQPRLQRMVAVTVHTVQHFSESSYGQVFAASVDVGREHWLTGVGIQGLRELTPKPELDAAGKPSSTVKEHFLHAHNPYLEWFAESGVPGLLLFIGLVGILLREALQLLWRTRGSDALVPAWMLGICLMHFFPVMSTQSYFSNWTGIMVWYSLGAVFALRALLPREGVST